MPPSMRTMRRLPAELPSKRHLGPGAGTPGICSRPERSMRAASVIAPTRSDVSRRPPPSMALVRLVVASAVAFWALFGLPTPAHAHVVGVSRGDYRVKGAEIVARL